jgi:hypothetical protein
MYTLIPEQIAKRLKKEYHIRVLILLSLFLSLGIWVGIIMLFPSYVISVTQEKKALAEAGSDTQKAQSASTTAAISQITVANSSITALQSSQDTLMISSIVEDITSRRIPGITISDFEIGRTDGTGTKILIQGKAATRVDLVAFENNLKADSRLTKVTLPVEDLASDTNISFTINMMGIQ